MIFFLVSVASKKCKLRLYEGVIHRDLSCNASVNGCHHNVLHKTAFY